MPKITAQIPKMSDDELFNLFKNAIRLLAKDENDAARSVINAIGREWQKRLERARAGKYSPETPQVGMLATLGYHVGQVSGEPMAVRRKILAHLMEERLPFVGSPAYTDEWGSPKSRKRYHKLVDFFGRLRFFSPPEFWKRNPTVPTDLRSDSGWLPVTV